MRLPHDLNSKDLINGASKMGYVVTRQTGSHIRLTTQQKGQHHITVPNHNPIKIGTLSAILSDIAKHFSTTKDDIINQFFNQ